MTRARSIPKWLKWEFWPFWLFYIPVYFAYFYYAARARSLSFFTLTNPGMKLGGFAEYSKYDILKQLHSRYLPKEILFPEIPDAGELISRMNEAGISFPIILKPDAGERGWKVEKIEEVKQVNAYLAHAPRPLLLQEYIALPEEYGVMYYRLPGEEKGTVSSVVIRGFLSVTGDGVSTLKELFDQSERCRYHMHLLTALYQSEFGKILPEGEKKTLVDIGNHSRGTTFLNGNHLITPQLAALFDEVSRPLHEWYFGRFDVRTASWSELLKGNFKTVEVNGVNSEPAHIYDPHMSLFKAYGAMYRHWSTIFRISRLNRKRGFKQEKATEVIRIIRYHLKRKRNG